MPFIPVDDIAVTLFLMNFFTARAEKKYLQPVNTIPVLEKRH
jgi:hypothetical protein